MRSKTLPLLLAVPALLAPGVSALHAQDNPMKVIIYNTQPAARSAARPAARDYRPRKRYEAPRPAPALVPVPEFLPDGTPNPDYKAGAMMPAPAPPPGLPEAPPPQAAPVLPAEQRPQVLVIGDSLAEALGFGLDADEGFKGEFTLRQKALSASGLVRDDFKDWPKTLPALLGEAPAPAAVIVMLGVNDRQVLRAGGEALAPLTPGWREAYGKRIDALIADAKAAKVPLIWVGLPAMRAPTLSTDLAQLNAMMRERVLAAGETFVDIFDGFADASGGFAATGPDIIGDTVRLRGPDGIHFTPAGQRKLAFFVASPLRKRLEASLRPALVPPPAAAAPGEAVPPPTPAPKPAAPQLPARERPAIGEVRPLGAAASAPALLGSAPAHQDPAPQALFEQGLSPAPRAGRADDYRWK